MRFSVGSAHRDRSWPSAGCSGAPPGRPPKRSSAPWRATSAGAARTSGSGPPPWRSPPKEAPHNMPRIIRQKVEFEGRIEEREVVIEGDDLPVWAADERFTVVGTPVPRVDGLERAGGQARYTTDQFPPGMLWGAILRSPHAHARIVRIDAAKAERALGVH